MYGSRRINQIASKRPQLREDTILIGASQPAISDDIQYQNGDELSGLAHRASRLGKLTQRQARGSP
jgi:hypothetical protein